MDQNRRDICLALAALGTLSTATGVMKGQAEPSSNDPKLLHSQLFPFDTLPVHSSANGGEMRSVVRGTLATGEYVEVHETTLPAGQTPHPPHRHTHSEFLLIRDGRLEVTSDGQHGFIEAGGVVFTASGVLHELRNVGSTPAHYFVVAVGIQRSLP